MTYQRYKLRLIQFQFNVFEELGLKIYTPDPQFQQF